MAINYEPVGWDTTKYFNPTNMNHMDDGIKAACDKADANEAAIADVNNNLKKVGTDEFTEYTFDTTKYKLLVITFFETSIVNSYVTVIIPSIIGIQQASIVLCGPVENVNYVYNVVVKFQVKTDGIGFAFAQFDSCSSSTLNRNLVISGIHNIVGIK